MAKSDNHMGLFELCPAVIQEVLIQFRVCHDICVYTSIEMLGKDTLKKVDQCAVDFRELSTQTATLVDTMSSVWCHTCLMLFKGLEKIIKSNYLDTMLKQISEQSKDLSFGFKKIGQWCGKLAARFHEAQQLADENTKVFRKKLDQAEQKADKLTRELASKLEELEITAKEKRSNADYWSGLASIPVIGFIFNEAAAGKNVAATSAEESVKCANIRSEKAKQTLSETKNKQEKANVR